MIVDGILSVVGAIIGFIGDLLPSSTLTGLPESISGLGETIGERAGPINRFFPVEELFTFLVIVFLYWLPAVLIYQLVFWIYKHLPVVGAG